MNIDISPTVNGVILRLMARQRPSGRKNRRQADAYARSSKSSGLSKRTRNSTLGCAHASRHFEIFVDTSADMSKKSRYSWVATTLVADADSKTSVTARSQLAAYIGNPPIIEPPIVGMPIVGMPMPIVGI